MTITVDAELMSALVDLFYQVRIFFNMFPDQKERGVDVMLCQHLQHPRRVRRMRTIIKSQCDLAARPISLPEDGWETSLKETEEQGFFPGWIH